MAVSEKSEARRDGSRLQKNSGRGKYQKGDAILGDFLVDYKEYVKSFSISQASWAKVCTDAIQMKKLPVLKLILGEGNKKTRVAVIEWSVFEELIEGRND